MQTILLDHTYPSSQRFQIVQGDITQEEVDAIVNAANKYLQHGGGVAGVISRRGGPQIQAESIQWVREHGPVPHDAPAYTTGGRLPCKYVIHAVGPVWGEGDEDTKLAAAISGSLYLAEELELRSITLPAISTGIFGFPKERAAAIFFETIGAYFTQNPGSTLALVRLCLFDQRTVEVFLTAWDTADTRS